MDPITLWIFLLATGWVIRSLFEDGIAAARGHPSPRIARRRARQQLAHEHVAATGTPPLTMAISTRLVRRIVNPPERRAWRTFRSYVDDVLADAWEDARTRHEQRRAQRAAARQSKPQPDPEPPPTSSDSPDPDHGGLDDPEIYDVEWFDNPDDAPGEPGPGDDPAPAPPQPDADPSPPPLPLPALPAPEPTTRKDNPPMSHPNTINGDVGSPAEALAYCESTLDLNRACSNEIDVALANLRGAGCGQDFLDIVAGGLTAVDSFHSAVADARIRYARHVVAHADLSSDPDLRNTLVGYLSAARA